MNSQKFRDARDGAIGFFSAFALGGAILVIVLGTFGYFDQGTTYKYPSQQRAHK